ncbi:Uncharacterised protein [Shimwellia blattae]|nr:Uncharacterised protein [Shimwellia blattae]
MVWFTVAFAAVAIFLRLVVSLPFALVRATFAVIAVAVVTVVAMITTAAVAMITTTTVTMTTTVTAAVTTTVTGVRVSGGLQAWRVR